ncbi:hypothetical protein ACJIZ3_023770 [Penstemon smallii]|uniref:HMG box domain-containing protein n=1 Tax=Penstemon smallii TaxID=265156 RepID=A0ABD3TPZ3_9LAMI
MLSKRTKKLVVNSRNVREKSEEEKVKRPGYACIWFYKHKREKMKSANIDEENGLNTTGEKDLMEHIKDKYHSLSDKQELMFACMLLLKYYIYINYIYFFSITQYLGYNLHSYVIDMSI